ncbi:MAG TPA: dienelactone hydrolase family protein [Casimicrobiaceae bacterium]|nr:dienelactone hydrolase family protein [Casimicrobiaceae bacterium]
MKRLAVALLCAGVALGAQARRVESVTFPSLDRDGNGATVLLHAMLLLPAGPARGARPAIVALHGCGGMYSTREGHEHELAERLALRADPLLRDGYAVLFVDSFRSRGLAQICTIRHADRTVKVAQRRLDALGALAYLAHRGDVAGERVALLGWSHGGSVALQAIEKQNRAAGAAFFRGAVAFYPGCASALALGSRYRPGAPTRVYIGELDDWTPAATCVELGKAMAARNEDLRVATYPDSYHGFDAPRGQLVHRIDVPNGVHPGEGVHVGPNAAAREAANASVRAFLRERLRD